MRSSKAAFALKWVNNDLEPWTGPVERRDPDTVRGRSVHFTWRCHSPHCGQWTMRESYRFGRCNFCNSPRPADDPGIPAPGDLP
jgi:hypothetical protein